MTLLGMLLLAVPAVAQEETTTSTSVGEPGEPQETSTSVGEPGNPQETSTSIGDPEEPQETSTTLEPPPQGGVDAGGGTAAGGDPLPWILGGALALLAALAILAGDQMRASREE